MRARRSVTTYSNYSCTRIPVDGPPTRVRVSGSLLALLTYEYPGGYGLNISTSVATLPGAWRYRVSPGIGWPIPSILSLGETESLICNFYQQVHMSEQIHPWDTLACCWDIEQVTTNQHQAWELRMEKSAEKWGPGASGGGSGGFAPWSWSFLTKIRCKKNA